MQQLIYRKITAKIQKGLKGFAVLLDPEKTEPNEVTEISQLALQAGVDYFLLGGSTLQNGKNTDLLARCIRNACNIPVILFPGSVNQVSKYANAILFMSLISGRNADYLIGKQVEAAPMVKSAGLETISTGYMLIDGGHVTSVNYVSQTIPLPADNPELAQKTALAGKMLGLSVFYLDAGSGATNPVSPAIIKAVKEEVKSPLIVGGGIRSCMEAERAFHAGADIVVIGNLFESNPLQMPEFGKLVREINHSQQAKTVLQ
jgi:phosphoglycerol geranylgeranyltransferase